MASGTRERIMDAALRLFGERGVAATPVTALEAAAGLSAGSGSFYRHFKDRNELLAAVVDREIVRVKKVETAQVRHPDAHGTPAEALARQLVLDLDFLRDLRPLIAILMWERGTDEIGLRVREIMMERGVEIGVADLLFRAPSAPVTADPAAAATVMMYAMVGYFLATDYFGTAASDVDPHRFTATLAALLTNPAE
jgi:AcrR family transcriptional regulator